jgi:cytochrome c-type protein NapC
MTRPFRLHVAALDGIRRRPVVGLLVVFVAGIIFWGGFNWSLEVTNTESFCISCHEMQTYVYRDYTTSEHFSNRTGVRASCPDCHVPREWTHKMLRKIAATKELLHWMLGSIDTAEKFAAKQPILARRVWKSMAETDSRECRNCHGIAFMAAETQSAPARTMHHLADTWGSTCIDCHKGIAHPLPRDFDREAEMDALHDRMADEDVDCRLCHEGMAGPKPGDGWD